MAKTSSIEKNNRRKKLSKQFAGKRAKLKATVMDAKISMEDRFAAQLKLSALPRNSAPSRVRNRCEVSGRPRGYYRKLKLSRIALRELGNFGQTGRWNFATVEGIEKQSTNETLKTGVGGVSADDVENGFRADCTGPIGSVALGLVQDIGVAEFPANDFQNLLGS